MLPRTLVRMVEWKSNCNNLVFFGIGGRGFGALQFAFHQQYSIFSNIKTNMLPLNKTLHLGRRSRYTPGLKLKKDQTTSNRGKKYYYDTRDGSKYVLSIPRLFVPTAQLSRIWIITIAIPSSNCRFAEVVSIFNTMEYFAILVSRI